MFSNIHGHYTSSNNRRLSCFRHEGVLFKPNIFVAETQHMEKGRHHKGL